MLLDIHSFIEDTDNVAKIIRLTIVGCGGRIK
jgi:hypothetical protein